MVSGASLAPGRDDPVVDGLMQREQWRFLQSGTGACARGRGTGFLIARFSFDGPAFSRAIGRQTERIGNGAQPFYAGADAPLHHQTNGGKWRKRVRSQQASRAGQLATVPRQWS